MKVAKWDRYKNCMEKRQRSIKKKSNMLLIEILATMEDKKLVEMWNMWIVDLKRIWESRDKRRKTRELASKEKRYWKKQKLNPFKSQKKGKERKCDNHYLFQFN